MPELHVVRSKNVREVLDEVAGILWTEYAETVVDAATDVQFGMTEPISSEELLRAGFMAGVRTAMIQMMSGNVEVEYRHDKKIEIPQKDAPQASAARASVRSLSRRAVRWLRWCICGR